MGLTVAQVGVEVVLSEFEAIAHARPFFVLALFRDVFETLSDKLIVVDGPVHLALVLEEDLVLLPLHERAVVGVSLAEEIELDDLPVGLAGEVPLDGDVFTVFNGQAAFIAHIGALLLLSELQFLLDVLIAAFLLGRLFTFGPAHGGRQRSFRAPGGINVAHVRFGGLDRLQRI